MAELTTGPEDPRSTLLSLADEEIVVAFRRRQLVPNLPVRSGGDACVFASCCSSTLSPKQSIAGRSPTSKMRVSVKPFWSHAIEGASTCNDVDHRLTKPEHFPTDVAADRHCSDE